MHPSAQYLPGEIKVAEGDVVPLTCAHNTVGVQFRVDDAEYIHVHKNDASFPQYHFAALKDTRRAEAYDAAIARQIAKINERDPRNGAHVLDVGAGERAAVHDGREGGRGERARVRMARRARDVRASKRRRE